MLGEVCATLGSSPLSGREYDGLGFPRLGPSHFEHAEIREYREPELFLKCAVFSTAGKLNAMKESAVTLIILMMFLTSAMIAVGAVYTAR